MAMREIELKLKLEIKELEVAELIALKNNYKKMARAESNVTLKTKLELLQDVVEEHLDLLLESICSKK